MDSLYKLFGKENTDNKIVTKTTHKPASVFFKKYQVFKFFFIGGGLSMHVSLRSFFHLLLSVCVFTCFLGAPTNSQTASESLSTGESPSLFRVVSVWESQYLELKTSYGFSGRADAGEGLRYVIVRLDFAIDVDSIDNSMLLLVGNDGKLFKSDGLGDEENKFCLMPAIILKRDAENNFCSLCAMTSGGPVSLIMFKTKQPAAAFAVPQTVPLSSLQISYQNKHYPLFEYAQDSNSPETKIDVQYVTGTMTDIDGNVYKTIKIGNQWWMAENLKVTRYRNGDTIHHVTDIWEWPDLTTGAYCPYKNDDKYIVTYGYLYNWYALNDSRNIAPEGWHVPTDEEWKELEKYLGISQSDVDIEGLRGDVGGKLKETGTTYWKFPNTDATNVSGFSALPGGLRYNCTFEDVGSLAHFWSSTTVDSGSVWYRALAYRHSAVYRGNFPSQNYSLSIRLIRD